MLTSNRTRELHDALKRRCLYHWIDYPTPEREAEIVRTRLPGVPEEVAARVCAAVARLRERELYKLPGVGETITWARALLALDGPGTLDDTLGVALKVREDIDASAATGPRGCLRRSDRPGRSPAGATARRAAARAPTREAALAAAAPRAALRPASRSARCRGARRAVARARRPRRAGRGAGRRARVAAVDASSRPRSSTRCARRCARRGGDERVRGAFTRCSAPRSGDPLDELGEMAKAGVPRVAIPPAGDEAPATNLSAAPAAWSEEELLREKDFAVYTEAERARRAAVAGAARAARAAAPLAADGADEAPPREHDLRETVRASLRHGGELLERRYREPAGARAGSC